MASLRFLTLPFLSFVAEKPLFTRLSLGPASAPKRSSGARYPGRALAAADGSDHRVPDSPEILAPRSLRRCSLWSESLRDPASFLLEPPPLFRPSPLPRFHLPRSGVPVRHQNPGVPCSGEAPDPRHILNAEPLILNRHPHPPPVQGAHPFLRGGAELGRTERQTHQSLERSHLSLLTEQVT